VNEGGKDVVNEPLSAGASLERGDLAAAAAGRKTQKSPARSLRMIREFMPPPRLPADFAAASPSGVGAFAATASIRRFSAKQRLV
jgi:hypothetical protein